MTKSYILSFFGRFMILYTVYHLNVILILLSLAIQQTQYTTCESRKVRNSLKRVDLIIYAYFA